ncbi:glycosyl hydrolase family 28 [Colletotrichum orchidophilum]|uniref:endo-polygalacturonase n=1 Tax=Colletotrichum orchidophilum TaxID=1209926 RepID=A0A1G4AMI7_9PEZI|nr:glycosyl hydrolase family 28 [Colletotrichum orchidophilum]OHE90384.1 glycosyl hydrolase family 28 [Colletotrichum orchidophilum]
MAKFFITAMVLLNVVLVAASPHGHHTSHARYPKSARPSKTAPASHPSPLPSGTNPVPSNSTGGGCVITKYEDIANAVKTCTAITLSNIAAPANGAIDLSDLKPGTTVTFAGTTTFAKTEDSNFDPIIISGTDITVTGAPGNVIDGNGPAYWDGQGSNGGSPKPDHFIVVKKTTNSKINNLNIKNWPVHCFSITGSKDLTVSDLVLDNSAGDAPNAKSGGKPAAHNSDGFDISSCDNVVLRNIRVINQDDCVAITSGTNITVDRVSCVGGHGISLGSIGGKSNNVVDGVMFSNSHVANSANGCRIKTNSGATGSVNNVTYKNITLTDIDTYGIDIQQDYLNGGPTGKPTNGVKISGISFIDVTGTVKPEAVPMNILCGEDSCNQITFENTKITGGKTSTCNSPASGCPS